METVLRVTETFKSFRVRLQRVGQSDDCLPWNQLAHAR